MSTSHSDAKQDNHDTARDSLTLKLARTLVESRRPRAAVGEIFTWKEGNTIVVRRNETLDRVLRKLTSENILSVPVISDNVACTYEGVVDIMDIVTYIAEELFAGETSAAWVDFFAKSEKFRETQVHEVLKHNRARRLGLNLPPVDVYHTIGPGHSLLHAFELLAQSGCHRLPVVNANGRIVGLYTSSMAVSDIRQSLQNFGALCDKRVDDCYQSECVYSVREDTRAIDAFRKLAELGISGAPVVDNDNVLVGTLSIRDLRGIGASGEHMARLYWTVAEFKEQARREHPQLATATHWSTSTVPRTARYVTPGDTFADIIRASADGCLHRVFVVSEESADAKKPVVVGVISQTDILKTVLAGLGTLNPNSF
jgi:CBS domain-containing protein